MSEKIESESADVKDFGAERAKAQMREVFLEAFQAGREGDVDRIVDLMTKLQAITTTTPPPPAPDPTDAAFDQCTQECFLRVCALLPGASPMLRVKALRLLSAINAINVSVPSTYYPPVLPMDPSY